MKKVMLVFGTRPEAIKMCPIIMELRERKTIKAVVCTSGQHRELLGDVLESFGVIPDYLFSAMKKEQSLSTLTCNIIESVTRALETERPDLVLVHGDTSTALCAALSAFYCGIDVGHVEAGLRTYNIKSPYPEEFNRRAISLVAKYHFAPTERSRANLLVEGVDEKGIFVTGNTAIDAMRLTLRDDYINPALEELADYRIIMLTLHRRENIGENMRNVFRALCRIVEEYKDVCVLYPAHPNPKVRRIAEQEFAMRERIHIIEPLVAFDFHNFLARCYMVVTDSGGIQEEAPYLGKPVLVARNTTERPEGIEAGTARLIGCEEEGVYESVKLLLDKREVYFEMAQAKNPYGDGFAASRIVDFISR